MNDDRFYEAVAAMIALVAVVSRAGGRLAPRVAIAPLVFMITRRPVLVAWALGAIGMSTMLALDIQRNGKDPFANLPLFIALSLVSGLGLAVPLVGLPFFIARAFAPAPVVELEPGERLIEELTANHFKNGESRGGKLLVTDRRLAFPPSRFNVQLDTWSVLRSDVTKLRPEGARMLVVDTADGAEHWLVVWQPESVATRLRSA